MTDDVPVTAGASQVSTTWLSPAAANRSFGGPGTPVDGALGTADTMATAPSPASFTARTEKSYSVPLVRPIAVTLRVKTVDVQVPVPLRYS